jgi:hypothetical protein
MSDAIEVQYETYFECIGPGKGKNKEWKCRGWKCRGCHQRWTCPPVTKLRAHNLKVNGKDIRLSTKSYSSQEVEAMQQAGHQACRGH